MGSSQIIEELHNCIPPQRPIVHLYAFGGNSICAGTLQYNTTNGSYRGMTPAHKAKYWDSEKQNIWALQSNYYRSGSMQVINKTLEPLYVHPEDGSDCYSAPFIIAQRLYELYGGDRHIAYCMNYTNGVGFKDTDTFNYNILEPDPVYQSKCLVKQLGRYLLWAKLHLESAGFDVRVKGIGMIGHSVVDVWAMDDLTYDKATLKTDITAVVNYFRNDLGFTGVPFYFSETTQSGRTNGQAWNDAINELNATLGNMYLHYLREWCVTAPDLTHINGESGVLCWGEGAETNGHKNMAELIYSVENT